MRALKRQFLDQDAVGILKEIFELTRSSGDTVDAVSFRAHHEDGMELLDQLERNGYLRKQDDRYRVTLVGLTTISDSTTKMFFDHFEKIFAVLRKHYKSTPKDGIKVVDLASKAGLTFEETADCLIYMLDGIWWASHSIDLRSPDAFVKPSESILRYKASPEAIAQLLKWHDDREAQYPASLKGLAEVPVSAVARIALGRSDMGHIKDAWEKVIARRDADPGGAITAARTLLETVCKFILDDNKVLYDDKSDFPRLYKLVAKQLVLAPNQHTEIVFQQILRGCTSVVDGIGTMRNRLGDSHGKGKSSGTPAARHADLAVNLAMSMASFLIATWEARKMP